MRRAGNKSVKRLPETEQSSPSKNFGSPIIIGNLGTSNRPHKEAPQKSGKTLEEPVTRADILKNIRQDREARLRGSGRKDSITTSEPLPKTLETSKNKWTLKNIADPSSGFPDWTRLRSQRK